MNKIEFYRNGNYAVMIFKNGTKIRRTADDEFKPAFAENCDCKITNKCDGNCSFCYENCVPDGKHADLFKYDFINSLHPYTELAINGNDLTHPDLIKFLEFLKTKNIFVNMTVNQMHFERNLDLIDNLIKNELIYGLGISLRNPSEDFIKAVKKYPNAVIHIINGIVSVKDIHILANNDLKLLILGYKNMNRGIDYYNANQIQIERNKTWLKENLVAMTMLFDTISFDNLAIEQLDVRSILSPSEWDEFYMGDDGKFTFYIDMVEGKFSKNSIAEKSERYDINNLTVDEMFNIIRKSE